MTAPPADRPSKNRGDGKREQGLTRESNKRLIGRMTPTVSGTRGSRNGRRPRATLCAALVIAACKPQGDGGGAGAEAVDVAAVPVTVWTARRGTVKVVARYPAEIRPSAQVNVFPRLADRVVRIGFEEGDAVVAGETVLAELASEMVDTGVRQAWSGVRAIDEQIAGLRTQQTRLRQLVADGVVAASQLDPIDAQIRVLEAQRRQVLSGVDQANLRKDDTIIKAPATGFISRRFVEAGDMASPAQPIATIVRLDPVFAWVDVPEHELEAVRSSRGVAIEAAAAPGRSFAAIPDLVSPSVDRESRTVRIRYRIDNADMVLRDGMIAVAKAELRRIEGVVVPSQALVMEPAIDDARVSYRVFLAVGSTARRAEMRVGIVEGAWAGVIEGVTEGDRVIVDGRHMVSDGAAIDVVGEATELSPPP